MANAKGVKTRRVISTLKSWFISLKSGFVSYGRKFYRAVTAPQSELSAYEAASPLFRFFRSHHVEDIRVIVYGTALLFVIYVVSVFLAMIMAKFINSLSFVDIIKSLIALLGPAFGIGALIIAWGYRSASTRLGVLDLFASEISTICRVGTVFNIGRHYVFQYQCPPPPTPPTSAETRDFVSEEHYFPVFDSNARDLQMVESAVVNQITQFYTYMKSTRDCLRKLAIIPPPSAHAEPFADYTSGEPDPWRAALIDLIYMSFLGYESARKVIKSLVDFEPAAAEQTMIILITELRFYAFLLSCFGPHHVHYHLHLKRLVLRAPEYKEEMKRLRGCLETSHGENEHYWIQAKQTLPDLNQVYDEEVVKNLAITRVRCKALLD